MCFVLSVPSFNNHFYTVMSVDEYGDNGITLASKSTFNGFTGYPASIDSLDEYAFIQWNIKPFNTRVALQLSSGAWKYTAGQSKGATASFLPWQQGRPSGSSCAALSPAGLTDVSCGQSAINVLVEFECESPGVVFNGACLGT